MGSHHPDPQDWSRNHQVTDPVSTKVRFYQVLDFIGCLDVIATNILEAVRIHRTVPQTGSDATDRRSSRISSHSLNFWNYGHPTEASSAPAFLLLGSAVQQIRKLQQFLSTTAITTMVHALMDRPRLFQRSFSNGANHGQRFSNVK